MDVTVRSVRGYNMNRKLKKAIDQTFDCLNSLDEKTFKEKLKEHENGEFASLLKYAGVFKVKNSI